MTDRPQFTSGPWEAWHDGKFVEIWADEGSKRPVIKWTGFDGCDRPLKEQRANARLIAAAPKLYAAVEELTAAIRGKGPRDGKTLARADAVLAEVRGVQ